MTQWGVDTLFNPAKRHMDEEKRRLQSTRAEVGDNSGGKRIDLESGKVRISRAGAPATPADEDEPDEDEQSTAEAAQDGTAVDRASAEQTTVDDAADGTVAGDAEGAADAD